MNKIDLDYQALVSDILESGVEKTDRTGTGTISKFGTDIRFKMSEGFPLLTTKKMYFKGVVEELLWFLSGQTNIKYLVENDCNIWNGDAYARYSKYASSLEEPDYSVHVDSPNENKTRIMTMEEFVERIKKDDVFANKWGELGSIYGAQWRNWKGFQQGYNTMADSEYPYEYDTKGIDQISNLIHTLKTNPNSRRMVVSAWSVADLDSMVLPPCHYSFECYTRKLNDKLGLSIKFNMRSTDVGLGLPFNIASYALLLEILAHEVDMIPDELIFSGGDTHIYKNHIEGLKEQLTRVPYNLPVLKIADDAVFGQGIDAFLKSVTSESFVLECYKSHKAIKLPLSN